MRVFVQNSLSNPSAVAAIDPHLAKAVLRKYVRRLMLIPKVGEEEKVYEVSGEIDLFEGLQRTRKV